MPIIDLYYWLRPNGHKITMFLEEADLDYQSCGRYRPGEQSNPISLPSFEQPDARYYRSGTA